MATVAITGATGFIGRQLVAEHLRRGDQVRILTRNADVTVAVGVEACVGDLACQQLPAGFPGQADILYHCAAELHALERMQAVNVEGTRRLAQAAAGRVGRWVQLSSVGVYGPRTGGEITEDAGLRPANAYELSKAAGDAVVLEAAARGGMSFTILRPSNVFGTGMPNRSLFQLAEMIRRGLFFFVGPPGASANYIPVDNVVDALLLCGLHPAAKGQVFNLSDWMTMEDFVGHMAEILKVRPPKLRIPLAPMIALAAMAGLIPNSPLTTSRITALSGRSRYPTQRIETELGYQHRVSLADGLRATLTTPRKG